MNDQYLLYSKVSSDGRERPDYTGRTESRVVAYEHYKKVSSDPYDSGVVKLVTDTEIKCLWRDEDWH